LDVFVFKQPPARSAFKAIGSALLGAIGAAVGPIGVVLGSLGGSYLGGKLYDGWFGGGSTTDKEDDTQSSGDGAASQQKSGGGYTGQVPPAGTNAKALLNTIRFAEGTSHTEGYNTWFGGSQYAGDLSRYTINEVVELQNKFLAEGNGRFSGGVSAAVGAYQMVEPEVFAVTAGYDPSTTKFTPEVQDKLAIAGYMKGQARMSQSQIDAPISREQIAQIAPVWASLPMMNGQSKYNQPVKSFETLQAVYNKSLGQGGGSGMVRPHRSNAKMKRNPVKNMYMPSMSTEFVINEKIKTNNIVEQPIIINNVKEENLGVHTTGITLNKGRKPVNQVLSRL
jgi:muramidase (phage lysozyme)